MVGKDFAWRKDLQDDSLDGLGQLSDGQTGPDNHEDAQGFQWVS